MPIRPESRVIMAILKPIPGSPKRLSFGILQSSKITLLVAEARMPNLSSFLPRLKPSSIYHLLPFLFHLFEDLYSALALRPFSSFIILESAYLQVHLLRRRYIFKESASVMAKCFALRKSLLKYHFGGIYESKCKQARIRAKKFPGLLPAFVKGC